MNIEGIKKNVQKIDGWLTDKEGQTLYNLARCCTDRGVIVEIGSWKGKSTIWLAAGAAAGQGKKVYAIDPHTGSPECHLWYGKKIWTFDEFRKNIKAAGLERIVIPIVKTSAEAAKEFDQPVELIFIDGDHTYQSVKQDFELWFPKLIEDGTIVFHDTGDWAPWIGPMILMINHLYPSRKIKKVVVIDSITAAIKTNNASPREIIEKFFVFFSWFLKELVSGVIRKTKAITKSTHH